MIENYKEPLYIKDYTLYLNKIIISNKLEDNILIIDNFIISVFKNIESNITGLDNIMNNIYKNQTLKLQLVHSLRNIFWENEINNLIYN